MFSNQAWAANPGRSFQAGSAPVRPQWRPAKLAGSSVELGQATELQKRMFARGATVGGLTLATLIAATTAFVGFRLGKTDHGIPSVLGYVVGGIGALATLGGLLVVGDILINTSLRPPLDPKAIV